MFAFPKFSSSLDAFPNDLESSGSQVLESMTSFESHTIQPDLANWHSLRNKLCCFNHVVQPSGRAPLPHSCAAATAVALYGMR
jgi:hypothetical protein